MISRKTKKADLENKKGIFLQIGLVVALALTLIAFEWKSYDKGPEQFGPLVIDDIIEEAPPITQEEMKLTPPPPPPPPMPTDELVIVDNKVKTNDVVVDVEATQKTEVKIIETVVEEKVEEPEIFTIVEEMPSFPGGDEALFKYLSSNIKYPQMAKEAGIQGTVYVTFVVDTDGNIKDVKVLRGIKGGCDEEAVRVVKAMPNWKPGKQRGKSVRVQYNLPIKFTLR